MLEKLQKYRELVGKQNVTALAQIEGMDGECSYARKAPEVQGAGWQTECYCSRPNRGDGWGMQLCSKSSRSTGSWLANRMLLLSPKSRGWMGNAAMLEKLQKYRELVGKQNVTALAQIEGMDG